MELDSAEGHHPSDVQSPNPLQNRALSGAENPENRLTDPQFFSRSISSTKERRTSEEREETNKQEIKNKNQNRENTHRRENWRTNREDG